MCVFVCAHRKTYQIKLSFVSTLLFRSIHMSALLFLPDVYIFWEISIYYKHKSVLKGSLPQSSLAKIFVFLFVGENVNNFSS